MIRPLTSRTARATLALALLAPPVALALPVTAAAGAALAPAAACERTSWLAGTTELCAGSLVYRDYVMDDYGARDPLDPTSDTVLLGSLSQTSGDERYPDLAKAGTADLVDLSLRIVGDRLVAVFETNALYDAGSTIGALAIDSDADETTGGGEWPGLGIESAGWDVLEQVDTGDVASNTLTLSMPVPAGDRWRVQAVTAMSDGTVMNVAFRGIDEQTGRGKGTWFESKQAQALADGDISAFGAEVSVADLRGGVTRAADHAAAGYHERVFTSAYTIGTGEGYSYDPVYGRHGNTGATCEQEFASFGRYQPYAVYVPEGTRDGGAGPGLQLYLHGCNANHSSRVDQPGLQRQYAEELDRILVAPLGRGPIGYYSDISERDVLEAAADANATYGFDPDRWHISGYSMGGYGAMRLAALYPHLWADISNWVGFTGDVANNPSGQRPVSAPSGGIGNVIDFVGNFEHIPSENLYAGADELVQTHTHSALALRMREAGVDHAYYLHPAAEHLTLSTLDEWGKEAAVSKGRTLVRDPARVRYRTDASFAFPEYGLVHDRAYWVSQVRAAGEGYSDVDLTTSACGGSLPVREPRNNAGPRPVPWVSNELRTTGSTPLEQADRLEGTTANVSSLQIDTAATCLTGKAVEYELETDGPLTLVTSDGRTLDLPDAGVHEGVLAAAGAAGPQTGAAAGAAGPQTGAAAGTGSSVGSVARPRALAATGAADVLPLAGLALLLGTVLVRRTRES